jgi:LCP family protein required for cell wall assembly
MMAIQNLSAEPPLVQETASPMPTPDVSELVPNTEADTEQKMLLTNGQKYFEQLVSPESTSVLLLGTDPTGFNFDTIMILNIDKVTKEIKLISLPRDIYIDYTDNILKAVKKSKPHYLESKGIYRINAVPSIGDAIQYEKGKGRFNKPYVDFIADIIEEIFAIHINDYAYVKVNGFRNIVNYFGSVRVYVPVLMNYSDPSQNFEVYLEKGNRDLNGAQAEGYVRFRQGYDENGVFRNYGDIFRKENQNRFVKAFITQHLTLKNLGKLANISEVISKNVITSVKGWDDIVEYGALAEEALNEKYPISNVELQVTDKNIDGSSYVLIKTNK